MDDLSEIDLLKQKVEKLEKENFYLKNNFISNVNFSSFEPFLSSIVNNLPIGFQLFDSRGNSILVNSRQLEVLSLKGEEYSSPNLNILENPLVKSLGLDVLFEKAYQGENTVDFEFISKIENAAIGIDSSDNRQIYNLTVFPIKDATDQVIAVVCLTQDITKHKSTVKALQESKNILEEAQNFGRLGTWRMDLVNQKITWSRQVFDSFGIDEEKGVPSYEEYQKLIHPEDLKILSKEIRSTLENGTFYEIEIRHRQPDNTYKWMFVKGKPIYDENERMIAISGVNLDIDSRKQAENKVKESLEKSQILNRELKKANSELDRFVYRCSHDLRAPISSMLGLIELSHLTNDVVESKIYLNKQEQSVKKLDNLIKDILDYSRNSRMKISKDLIDFHELTEKVLFQFDDQAMATKILKQIDISQDEPFYTDKRRLTVIFNNILSNSFKFVNKWNPYPKIEVDITVSMHEATIIFTDNGEGIIAEHQNKVFDMFYKANESKAGSGLGLYIVKETVDKLGGNIIIDSELGEGTTVTVKIPNQISPY